MTRINTNVTSLVAQNILGRSNSALEESLNRLSTGLRINTGKDDPAGLIASENLRSDITSIKRAISNTDRANQVIATADSALGQVSALLNDIRGLVTEAANSGASGPDQIAADQLQIDSSLEALNRIAQTTTFQGRRLLDGSLNFITTAGTGFGTVADLKIDQANLGATGQVAVAVDISAAATRAQITNADIAAGSGTGVKATATLTFTDAASQATGTATLDTANSSSFELVAAASGDADGDAGNAFTSLVIVDDTTEGTAYDAQTGVLTVTIDIAGGNNTVDDLVDVINAGSDFTVDALTTTDGGDTIADTNTGSGTLTGGADGADDVITVTSATSGTTPNGLTVTIAEANGHGAPTAALDGSGNIVVTVDDTAATTIAQIASAIDGLAGYSATVTTSQGDGDYVNGTDNSASGTFASGAAGGGLDTSIVFEIAGSTGGEVLSFGAGTSLAQIVAAVNAVSDATGVSATDNSGTLELDSTGYGSDAFVAVNVLSGDTNDTFADGLSSTRVAGTDIVASVNGIEANGHGNTLSINTATLDLTLTVDSGSSTDVNFTIVGGGALFQLGPDVVSNQQARIGITSVNTARLGGVNGKLFQLGSGGTADLVTDANTGARIVEEAIDQITSLRGRLGAFQRTSLETNRNALGDTLVNLTEAESQIRDADFASETAALTRAQILVQSGTAVLQIANQNPQNVLALLR